MYVINLNTSEIEYGLFFFQKTISTQISKSIQNKGTAGLNEESLI